MSEESKDLQEEASAPPVAASTAQETPVTTTEEDKGKEATTEVPQEQKVDATEAPEAADDAASNKRKREDDGADEPKDNENDTPSTNNETAGETESDLKRQNVGAENAVDTAAVTATQPVETAPPTLPTPTALPVASMPPAAVMATQPTPQVTTIPIQSPAQQPPGTSEILLECPQHLVGRVIGKGGETIRDLQMRSGCTIQINQNFPEGQPRQISVSGPNASLEMARQLLTQVMHNGPSGSVGNGMMGGMPPSMPGMPPAMAGMHHAAGMYDAGPQTTHILDCPQHMVGRVIGKGGETIKSLQAMSGCRIQINQDFPEGMPRKITVSGSAHQVPHGIALVQSKITEPSEVVGGTTQIIDCPKSVVGRVIGRGGETINDLQARSGARIQIDQSVPEGTPCKITVSGNPSSVEMGVKMVNDVIAHGPSHMQQQAYGGMAGYGQNPMMGGYGGGYGAPYGGGAGGGYGGYGGGYPQQQQYGGATGGYGAMQQQQQQQQQQPPMVGGGYGQAPPSSDWSEHKDGSGNSYWYNAVTGQSQWENPFP